MQRNKNLAVVTFRFQGKRLSVSGKTKKEAQEKAILKRLELERGIKEITSNITVEAWATEWLETYKGNGQVGRRWYVDMGSVCKRYIFPSIGKNKIKDVKPLQLQRIVNENVKSKSFNDKLYLVIKQIFKTAYINDLIAYDITLTLKKNSAVKGKPRRSITDHERELLLKVLEGHRGKLFCYLMLYAGLRPGEAAALLWRDVDFDAKMIDINKALKADDVIKPQPKSNAGFRKIPIQNKLLEALKAEKGDPFSYVCINEKGNPYKKRTILAMWHNVKRQMNIANGAPTYRNKIIVDTLQDDLYLYCLRHTFCTDLQAAGVPINVTRELMGHSDISVTSKIYTHHSDVSIANALDSMNRYVSGESVSVDPLVVPTLESRL